MARKSRNYHVGGQQMPLLTPESSWQRPSSLPDLRGRVRELALDRETNDEGLRRDVGPGWATGQGNIIGVSAAWMEGSEVRSFYAPTAHPDSECFDPEQVAQWERDHQRAGVRFIYQNAPYDVGWGDADWRVPCPELLDDTTCMAFMVDEQRLSYDLDSLCRWQGLPGKDEALLDEALAAYGFPTGDRGKGHLHRLPARYVGPYAEIDAVRTLQLAHRLRPHLSEQRLEEAYALEIDLIPMVHAMRKRGIRVDLEAAARGQRELLKISGAALAELREKLGTTMVGIDELRSNSWLDQTFTQCKVRFPRNVDGRGSFEKAWMQNSDHWLPLLCVKAKSYHEAAEKFLGTFVMGFAHNGRLHASINQFKSEEGGTRTYRFSYSDPPLQQMPNRVELMANIIRGAFLPEPGAWWLSADYSQQEYRLIVHFAEKLGLRKAREAGDRYRADPRTDFHSMVAELTGLERKPAKDTNFAKSYGAGVKKFATMINKPLEEAEAIMNQYDERMPFNKELFDTCQKRAEKVGYIRLMDGARIRFDTWEPTWLSREERGRGWGSGGAIKMASCSLEEAQERRRDKSHPWYGKRLRRSECRKASNGLIQGNAARMTKKSMRDCWRAGYTPMLQMHDELDFSVYKEREGREIVELMRNAVQLTVPVVVDAEYGSTWGKAKNDWKNRAGKRS